MIETLGRLGSTLVSLLRQAGHAVAQSRLAAWVAIATALVLPAFMQSGYWFTDLQFAIALLAALGLGAIIWAFAPPHYVVTAILIACLISLYAYLYLYSYDWPYAFHGSWEGGPSALQFFLVPLIAFGLCVITKNRCLTIVAAGAVASLVGASIEAPAYRSSTSQVTPNSSSEPAVIHILLDEHASDIGLPPDIFTDAERNAVWDQYADWGFRVYLNSYSLDEMTHTSLARLFNPSIDNPIDALTRTARLSWRLVRADLAGEIGQSRRINLQGQRHVDLLPLSVYRNVVSQVSSVEDGLPSLALSRSGLSVSERMEVALAGVHRWLLLVRRVPLYVSFILHTEKGQAYRIAAEPLYAIHPGNSFISMERYGDFLAKKGVRGNYYFAHFLLPHHAYVFDAKCKFRSPQLWLKHNADPAVDSHESRRVRYKAYFEQLKCTQTAFGKLLQAVESNPQLKDAVVIAHGDHGSRIAFKDRARWLEAGGSAVQYERDQRAAFFAVRIPGALGGAIEQPAAIHDLFANLVRNGFKTIDAAAIPVRDDPMLAGP